jgi:hypothetical protein
MKNMCRNTVNYIYNTSILFYPIDFLLFEKT